MKHLTALAALVLLLLVGGCGLIESDDSNDGDTGSEETPPQGYLETLPSPYRYA